MVCCAPNRSIFRLFFIHIFLVFHSVSVWERRKLSPVTHWNTAGFSSIASVWFVISDRDVHIDPSQQDFSLLRACVRMWFSVLCTVIPFVIHTFFNISSHADWFNWVRIGEKLVSKRFRMLNKFFIKTRCYFDLLLNHLWACSRWPCWSILRTYVRCTRVWLERFINLLAIN